MNAKETLKKIAEALNLIDAKDEIEAPEKPIEETTEKPVEETVEESIEKTIEETAEKPIEENDQVVEETVVENEEVVEQEAEQAVEEQPKQDDRVSELESQIEALKQIIANAIEQDEQVPEIPKEEPKGLTHSPEKEVSTKANGLGNKGESIESRVWKYLNQ